MHRVLVSDRISQNGIKVLQGDVKVDYKLNLSREEFLNIIGDYDGIIVRSFTQLDSEALEKAKKLKVIGRAGTGYDNIDVDEATKRGIVVFNTPTGNTISAVEHTMGLLLSLSRNIPQANDALHKGIWDRKNYMGIEIKGKTLGIIGLGKIGSRVAQRAQSFGMNVIANDPYLAPEKAENLNVPLVTFNELLNKSDYISLHTPLTEETYHILSHKEFAMMKDNVRIINCARGKNIDTKALAEAIGSGKVAGAAIDVHEEEPFDPDDNPLIKYKDKVIMTCHLGGTTTEAMDNVSITAAEEVFKVLEEDGLPESPLNIPAINQQEMKKGKHYLNLINKLGNFIVKWKGHERINKIEIEYSDEIVENHNLKPFTITLIKDILDPILDNRVNLVNAQIVARERGIDIKESHISEPEGLTNIIRVKVNTNEGNYSIAGTALPIGLRMIEINNYRIDLELAGKYLIVTYKDRPGVIGKIGTTLGKDGVNIGSMQVGRQAEGGEAIMIIRTDSKPTPETMNNIEENSKNMDIIDVAYLEL